jgi:polar amino acid transport system permease protein
VIDWWWDIVYLSRYLPKFLNGVRVTVEVSVLAFVLGILIGLLGAAVRQSRVAPLRAVVGLYVEIIRNTPTLVQIFLIYFGLPTIGLHLTNYQAGVIALGVSGGGYFIEIIRAGFDAIPRGQREAATTLGLSRSATYFHVLLPQAVRTVYPPIIGQFIQMILGSSMLSVVGVAELTGESQLINAATYRTIPTFLIALALYLVLTNVVSLLSGALGRVIFRAPLTAHQRRTTRPVTWRRRFASIGTRGTR